MKLKNSHHPFAILTILMWSCAYVFSRLALSHFTPYTLGFLRYAVASAAILIVVLATKMKAPARRDLGWFLAAGASGIALYMITFNKGCQTLNSSTSSVIIAIVPVVTSVMARFIYKEHLRPVQWLAIAVSFAGVVVLTVLRGSQAAFGGLTIDFGILWLLAAVVLLSLFNILQRRLTKTYAPLQVSAFGIFSGTLLLSVFLPPSVQQAVSAPAIQWVYLLILGVGSSAIAYCAWAAAFARAEKTSSVSNYMFVTPFLATLLGVIIAGETLDAATVIGGIIILSGLLLYNFGGKRRKAQSAAASAETKQQV
jgi:drug/metabolite transporter (DMT)-like permease